MMDTSVEVVTLDESGTDESIAIDDSFVGVEIINDSGFYEEAPDPLQSTDEGIVEIVLDDSPVKKRVRPRKNTVTQNIDKLPLSFDKSDENIKESAPIEIGTNDSPIKEPVKKRGRPRKDSFNDKSRKREEKYNDDVESYIHSLIEEQDRVLKNNCKNIKCYVKVSNLKIDHSPLEQDERTKSLKRKRISMDGEDVNLNLNLPCDTSIINEEKEIISVKNDIQEMRNLTTYNEPIGNDVKTEKSSFIFMFKNESIDIEESETLPICNKSVDIEVKKEKENISIKTESAKIDIEESNNLQNNNKSVEVKTENLSIETESTDTDVEERKTLPTHSESVDIEVKNENISIETDIDGIKNKSDNESVNLEEIDLIEDTLKKNIRKNNNSKKKPLIGAELSEYDKIRLKNIKEREAMLLSLNLKEAFDEFKSDSGLIRKEPSAKKSKTDASERRRSERLDAKTDPDPDYNPKEEVMEEDPKDHTHQGLRKQPCKECSNCLVRDCRKCIYCRDKSKYGGPNKLKQKCEYKEKCSQPIITCYVCKGEKSFTCDECNKRFPYIHLLEEHSQNVHQVEIVKRRSSRRSTSTINYVED